MVLSPIFTSLAAFDAAAKAEERDRFFQARLQIRALPATSIEVLFERGSGNSQLSPEEHRCIYLRESKAPQWRLACPQLHDLAEQIDACMPDTQRVFFLVVELRSGTWELCFGRELAYSHTNSELTSLVVEAAEWLRAKNACQNS